MTFRESFSKASKATSTAGGTGSGGWEPILATAFAIWWRIVGLPEDDADGPPH